MIFLGNVERMGTLFGRLLNVQVLPFGCSKIYVIQNFIKPDCVLQKRIYKCNTILINMVFSNCILEYILTYLIAFTRFSVIFYISL